MRITHSMMGYRGAENDAQEIAVGEASRRAKAGNSNSDTFRVAAGGFIVQKGGPFLEQAMTEAPQLRQDGYFNDAVQSWINDPAHASDFLVYVQRHDGRKFALMAGDLHVLDHSAIPKILGEFHARMECCPFKAYVSPDVGAALQPHLAHEHPQSFKDSGMPGVKRLRHPDYGDMVFVEIPRKLVERGQVAGVLRVFDAMVATAEAIKKNAGCVILAFDGYDETTQEIFEHAEIRSFIGQIVENAPWWLALAHSESFLMWFGATVPYTALGKDSNGTVRMQFDPESLRQRVDGDLSMVSILLDAADIPAENIEEISRRLSGALSRFIGGGMPETRMAETVPATKA